MMLSRKGRLQVQRITTATAVNNKIFTNYYCLSEVTRQVTLTEQ